MRDKNVQRNRFLALLTVLVRLPTEAARSRKERKRDAAEAAELRARGYTDAALQDYILTHFPNVVGCRIEKIRTAHEREIRIHLTTPRTSDAELFEISAAAGKYVPTGWRVTVKTETEAAEHDQAGASSASSSTLKTTKSQKRR